MGPNVTSTARCLIFWNHVAQQAVLPSKLCLSLTRKALKRRLPLRISVQLMLSYAKSKMKLGCKKLQNMANDPQVKDQLPTQSRVELLRKSGMSTGKLRDELYCIERKIQTGRKNLFKKKEMLETVLKAGKAGRGGPHIYTDPKTKTTIHCVSKEEKDARGNVYTAWLKVENDCNLFQDHWVVFVDKLNWKRRKKGRARNAKSCPVLILYATVPP
eukprot:g4532.t1